MVPRQRRGINLQVRRSTRLRVGELIRYALSDMLVARRGPRPRDSKAT